MATPKEADNFGPTIGQTERWPQPRSRISVYPDPSRVKESPPRAAPDALYRAMNPWWEMRPGPPPPRRRRRAFNTALRRLDSSVVPIVALRGPRQVGKSTIQEQLIDHLINDRGVAPRRIFRVQCDELPFARRRRAMPILEAAWWFEKNILKKRFAQALCDGEEVFLFLDEVQHIDNWAVESKHLVDINKVKMMIAGSSSLSLKAGQNAAASRLSTITIGALNLSEIAQFQNCELAPALPDNSSADMMSADFWRALRAYGAANAAARDRAFARFSEVGGYPLAHNEPLPWGEVAQHLKERVIECVVDHDLRAMWQGRRPMPYRASLRSAFRIACRYCGQAPRITEIAAQMRNELEHSIDERQAHEHLQFFSDALLLRRIEPQEMRLKRRLGSDKLCLADHALRAAWLGEKIPLDPQKIDALNATLAGRIAESVAGACLADLPDAIGLYHYAGHQAGAPEVDYVLLVGDMRIPIEVKYRRVVRKKDTEGLRAYIENPHHRAPFGVLITQDDAFEPDDPRVIALPLSSFLLLR